jgi:hypothetical protein
MSDDERRPLALLVCGALMREVRDVVLRRGWDADLHAAPALNHLSPKKLVADVDDLLGELGPRYERVVVVYGDCGTNGALDAVLERHGAHRVSGPHCYEMLGHPATQDAERLDPGLFFLTDWLVRNWDKAVVQGLGIDRFPYMKDTYFEHVTRLLFLRQEPEPALEERARGIAAWLDRPLEIVDVGLGDLERRLVDLVEEPSV